MRHLFRGVETVKRYVNVYFNGTVSNLKKISKISTLPPTLEKFLRTTMVVDLYSMLFNKVYHMKKHCSQVLFSQCRLLSGLEKFPDRELDGAHLSGFSKGSDTQSSELKPKNCCIAINKLHT